jgi:hypothetical protein
MAETKYSFKRLMDNKYVYKVLREIATKEEGNYSTQIAKELGKGGREEATRVCRRLEEIGLVKKGKRTKAQYYELDKDGLVETFRRLIENKSVDEIEDVQKEVMQRADLERNEEKENLLVQKHATKYLEMKEESSIRAMLIQDYFFGLSHHKATIKLEEQPEWFVRHYFDLSLSLIDMKTSPSIIRESLEEIE